VTALRVSGNAVPGREALSSIDTATKLAAVSSGRGARLRDTRRAVLLHSSKAIMRIFEITGIDEHPRIEIRNWSAEPMTTV
jgi:hypothetical protein